MVETVVSIHRRKDLRHARVLSEYVRRQKGWSAAVVIPDWVVERLADQLQLFREQRQAALAGFKAELEREVAEVRAEMARAKAILDALKQLNAKLE
jgi:hypothetical protein